MGAHDDEVSQRAGDVVEGYEFIGPQITYRHTSGTSALIIDGQLFAPGILDRTALVAGGIQDTPALAVTMPVSSQLVKDYGFTTPPRSLRLKVHRKQARSGEVVIVWDGQVVSLTPRGRRAEVKSVSQLGARLGASVPSISYQRMCNHFLYDARCRVDRLTFDHTALITGVNATTITINTIGIAPDQWFRAGEIVRDVDGERRTIVDQVGAVLKLSSPFRSIANGDAVTMYAGCDHSIGTCSDKFNNRANYGGHPSVPSSNPWIVGIALTRGT